MTKELPEEVYKNKDWLMDQYWNNQLTYDEMVEKSNSTYSKIKHWMQKYNIKGRTESKNDVLRYDKHNLPRKGDGRFLKGHSYHYKEEKPFWNKKWLYNEYIIKQKPAKKIADEQGCNENNILHFLEKHNIRRRSTSEVRKIHFWGMSGKDNPMYGIKGEQAPNWRGGITPERQSFYASEEWKRACSNVWKRDNGICQRCGDNWRYLPLHHLHVHHIISFEVKEYRADVDKLLLLCKKCHFWVHSKKNKKGEYIKEVN